LIVRTLNEDSLPDAKPELDRLAGQRRDLDKLIAQAERAGQRTSEDPEDLADRVLERLASLNLDWSILSPASRRDLIQRFQGILSGLRPSGFSHLFWIRFLGGGKTRSWDIHTILGLVFRGTRQY